MGTPKKENNNIAAKNTIEQYGRVILTLKNCLLPEEKLLSTPTQNDGLDAETEMDLRILGCELIQTAGILLKLPQVAMATAQVLFQRFYYSKSFVRQSYEITGMGCLYLASKIEESLRRIRDVINVFHHIKQVNNQKTLTPMILDQNYIALKYQVIKAERRVLKELGFCVHVKHPHKLIVIYLQVLGLEKNPHLMQLAWNYMNDSLRTDVFVRYQPETVACACIYLTARKLKLPLPKSPPWFHVFKVEEIDIQDVVIRILRLYTRSKPKVEVLEKKVQEVCKKFEENKLKNKTGFNSSLTSGNNTPNSPNVVDKKSPKRRSHSDRSRSRSVSSSPRHKKSRKYKRSITRSRSRSRSYDKKYKKKNSRRSRSPSPVKRYKDKSRYRSRSRSYDRDRDYYTSSRRRSEERYKKNDKYYKDEEESGSGKKNNNNSTMNKTSSSVSKYEQRNKYDDNRRHSKNNKYKDMVDRHSNNDVNNYNKKKSNNSNKHRSDDDDEDEDDDDVDMIVDEDDDIDEVEVISVRRDKKSSR